MSALVLDASAATWLVLGSRGHEEVRRHLRDQILSGQPILVPALFWLEMIERMVESRHRPDALVEAVYELEQLGIEAADVGRPGVLAVIDAVARGLSAHEAAYLVLAESADARLLTATPMLAAVAGDRAILVGRRSGPPRVPRPDRSWAKWKGAAAYLRQLRTSL